MMKIRVLPLMVVTLSIALGVASGATYSCDTGKIELMSPLTPTPLTRMERGAKALLPPARKQLLHEKWGIELTALRVTAAGHMVDFRYRVTDAEKAAPLFKRQTKPYLLHQASGKSLAVPKTAKIGALRNSNTPQAGRIYWMFFGNHHRLVNKGDKVTITIGEFQVADIEVG